MQLGPTAGVFGAPGVVLGVPGGAGALGAFGAFGRLRAFGAPGTAGTFGAFGAPGSAGMFNGGPFGAPAGRLPTSLKRSFRNLRPRCLSLPLLRIDL